MYRGRRLWVRAWRDTRYLTQQELADKAEVSRQTIVSLERPENPSEIRPTNLRKLAAALGVSPDDLFRLPQDVTENAK